MKWTLSIIIFFNLFSHGLSGQQKTRLPESGLEPGIAITPIQISPFSPAGFRPTGSNTITFDPLPEIFLKIPAKKLKIRISYDYSSVSGNYAAAGETLNRLEGSYTQHAFSAGLERRLRAGRNKFYLFGDLRYTWSWFEGNLFYGTGIPATIVEAEVAMSGLGAKAGAGWKYNITGALDLFVESWLAADRIFAVENDIFIDGTNILPGLFTLGLIYRFELMYDCNCPDNTIRR